MRQPICGWLLAAVVVSAAPSAHASTLQPAPQASRGVPCATAANSGSSADSNCCHAPDFKTVRAAPPASVLAEAPLQPASNLAPGSPAK